MTNALLQQDQEEGAVIVLYVQMPGDTDEIVIIYQITEDILEFHLTHLDSMMKALRLAQWGVVPQRPALQALLKQDL